MNGILCIDKPQDFTSFDVVAKLRGMAKTKKVGHGGTLDPMATGVLPLFLGGATKAIDLLPRQDKRYLATFRLGTVTDTLDITGTVLERNPVAVGRKAVEEALMGFVGKFMQLPPMYSAVQVGGKRLYDLAREGKEVERVARAAEIYSIALVKADEENGEYQIDVHSGKGVYIRSLCHDVGQKLKCGAVLTELRRTQACGFGIGDCITLQQAQSAVDAGTLLSRVLPVELAFAGLPAIALPAGQARLLQNGVQLGVERLSGLPELCTGNLRVYGPGDVFLGIAYIEEGRLKVRRLFLREVPV